jgi:hypothetical protein
VVSSLSTLNALQNKVDLQGCPSVLRSLKNFKVVSFRLTAIDFGPEWSVSAAVWQSRALLPTRNDALSRHTVAGLIDLRPEKLSEELIKLPAL